MHPAVLHAAQIAATVGLLTWMITGFTPLPGRWFRWKMFCRGTFTITELTGTTADGHTEPVNPFDYTSPGSFLVGPVQVQAIVTYLVGRGRYTRIDGHGRVLSGRGEQRMEVTNSRVVVR